jgi:hypothetical protein
MGIIGPTKKKIADDNWRGPLVIPTFTGDFRVAVSMASSPVRFSPGGLQDPSPSDI